MNLDPEELCHPNRLQGQDVLNEANNLLQANVFNESELNFTSRRLADSRKGAIKPVDALMDSEGIQKIQVYPIARYIPLNPPSLPIGSRQFNNDLGLTTFTIEPISTRI